MRSRKIHTLSSAEVHAWTLQSLIASGLLKDHGWLCTAAVVWNVLLRAAARASSVYAACRDMAGAPSDQAVRNALRDCLPKKLKVLERRLNEALVSYVPKHVTRRAWRVAIDWHLTPYYGEPQESPNELYYGKPKQGTTKFHAYATACIVEYGHRYTLAVSWVRRHESNVTVLKRLLARIREIDVKIDYALLDRAFFNVPVVQFLQDENVPFVMPVMFRGRPPKKGRPPRGLHAIKRNKAGWYSHTLKNGKQSAEVSVCVTYRTHRNRKDGKRVQQKLLFATWRVTGTPTNIRQEYRKRFGIESSYRQMRQAKIYTCTRDPHLRLLFIVLALLLRNVWAYIHATYLAEGRGPAMTLHLERLRFRRMLDWLAIIVFNLMHDGTTPYTQCDP